MDKARIIEVVEATIARRGDGVKTPIRIVTQYFDKDGIILAESDPGPDERDMEIQMLKDAIMWALGENGEFNPPGDKEVDQLKPFWWRKELRARAGL
ncbi:MAG: hypothetical protein AB2806_08735 [Candidatus Thiodiazotropha sp.]